MISFYKYEGTGNNFILIEGEISQDLAVQMCEHGRGIGADGVLLLSEIDRPSSRVRMHIINADGSRPEMCGNGVRCVALHLFKVHNFNSRLSVVSDSGEKFCEVESSKNAYQVRVNMGSARLVEELELVDEKTILQCFSVDIGNPHAVVFNEPDSPLLDVLGEKLNHGDKVFKNGVNLEFVVKENDALRMVVFERGVGRTLACGTGACAVAFAAWESGLINDGPIEVRLPGGDLEIEKEKNDIWMRGPVRFVFSGHYSEQ